MQAPKSLPLTRKRARMLIEEGHNVKFDSIELVGLKKTGKRNKKKKSEKPIDKDRRSSLNDEKEVVRVVKSTDQGFINPIVESEEPIIIRKIEMTHDEMSMNGAPGGELYDAKVCLDSELAPLNHSHFDKVLETYFDVNSDWGAKYSAMESIRRITLHNPLSYTQDNISNILNMLVEALVSLRSCIIRNAIFCSQSLFATSAFKLFSSDTQNYPFISSVVSLLLNKTVCGPKFLCDLAVAAIGSVEAQVDPSLMIYIFSKSIDHKQPEAANRSFMYISQAVLNHLNLSGKDGSCSQLDISNVLALLGKGMQSKRPSGREASKRSIIALRDRLGSSELFEILNTAFLSDSQRNDIQRICQEFTSITSSASNGITSSSVSSAEAASSSSSSDKYSLEACKYKPILKSSYQVSAKPRISMKEQMLKSKSSGVKEIQVKAGFEASTVVESQVDENILNAKI